jgi:hypothetical protein
LSGLGQKHKTLSKNKVKQKSWVHGLNGRVLNSIPSTAKNDNAKQNKTIYSCFELNNMWQNAQMSSVEFDVA